MKKLLLALLALPVFNSVSAQEYQSLQATGFNADVIANGVGASAFSTSIAMDNANYAFISADFQATAADVPPAYALPVSGTITDPSILGLGFQLADYSGNNSLRLPEQFNSGTLVFGNPVSATNLYLLASSGSGNVTLAGTIHFSDNSIQDIGAPVIPDWFFSNALPVVISGFGRINTTNDIIENPTGDPRLYRYDIQILPENQPKTITSIDISKNSSDEGVANIFAVSAKLLGSCPAPTTIVATAVTETSATISWNAAVVPPANGYQYYFSSANVTPTAGTVPAGAVSAGATSANLIGLSIGVHYCVWVRSICSDTEVGPWSEPTCFTTGEISTPYTGSDIPTLYSFNPDATTDNTCPGTITINVPAGYQISSVATSYDMQTASNGWMSEQRSLLVCTTNGIAESALTSGAGSSTGTYHYERSGIGIASGLTGAVNFDLRAWRTYGGSDCNTDYNRVLGNTWTVTITYQPSLKTENFGAENFVVYPNPAENIINISGNETINKIEVFNLLGQEVLQADVNEKTKDLDISALSSGKYLMRISSEKGMTTKGIMKK